MPRLLSHMLCGAALFGAALSAAPSSIDEAFARFWHARNVDEAAKLAQDLVKTGVSFDDALARLKHGRPYAAAVKRGTFRDDRRTVLGTFGYEVQVPETYDPSHRYQVRFQLHGGVMMRDQDAPRAPGRGRGGPLAGAEQIYVLPTSWRDAPWWSRAQIENLSAILDAVKRTYNVDENRVVVSGVSDGGTGAYYIAMRETTPFASFLPLNGSLMVLANDRIDVDGELFPTNLLNKPLFVVNGGQDPLYPEASIRPFVEHLKWSGVTVDYHPQPNAGHNTLWWPDLKDTFEAFVAGHPRDPLPAKLTWEATDRQLPARAHWIVIDRVTSAAGLPRLEPDLNVFSGSGYNRGRDLFARVRPSGRVDAERSGNTITLRTRGVSELTLLLSPDVLDFSQPVIVEANGRRVSSDRVAPSLSTLLKWAARDNDRTMLFGAELHLTLK